MIKIIYEDNHLIAVIKPAGMPSQPDKSGDVSMYDMVKDYIRIKKGKPLLGPGNARPVRNREGSQRKISNGVFVGLLHRLDRPVSGIMLFAKTSKGAAHLSEQFRNHEIEKTYHVLVTGKPAKSKGVLVNYLGKDQKLKKAKEYADGEESVLHYEVVKSWKPFGSFDAAQDKSAQDDYSLLRIIIEGGKFHQIRAQLSLAGFPIVGDIKYDHPSHKATEWQGAQKSIALCATGLSFITATSQERINLSIDIPKEWEKYLK